MAGPFHHDLGRDAGGKGKADEGASAGMGADEFVFGFCTLLSFSSPISHAGNRRIELAELAKGLQIIVHLLVGNDRKDCAIWEALVFVFGQNLFSEGVEIDGESIVGFLRSDVHGIPGDVRTLEIGHIGVTEAGEGAEAEHIPGLGQWTGIVDHLFVLLPSIVMELYLGAVSRDLVVVEFE